MANHSRAAPGRGPGLWPFSHSATWRNPKFFCRWQCLGKAIARQRVLDSTILPQRYTLLLPRPSLWPVPLHPKPISNVRPATYASLSPLLPPCRDPPRSIDQILRNLPSRKLWGAPSPFESRGNTSSLPSILRRLLPVKTTRSTV